MFRSSMFGYRSGMDTGAASAAASAAQASSAARTSQREVAHLEERIDRLALVCMAMWSLIQDKTRVTEEELMERVKAIDLMDGVEDSKATRSVAKCSNCSRTMSPRHRRCLYCGADKLVQSAFDAV